MSTSTMNDPEMQQQALSCLQYANSFYQTLENSLNNGKQKFNEDLLYNLAVMSVEKYFVALLAFYDVNASHHMPIALYKESIPFEPELTETMKQTAILIGKFEAICSLDDFGYRTPSLIELQQMRTGLMEVKQLVEKRLSEQ